MGWGRPKHYGYYHKNYCYATGCLGKGRHWGYCDKHYAALRKACHCGKTAVGFFIDYGWRAKIQAFCLDHEPKAVTSRFYHLEYYPTDALVEMF